MKKSSAQLSDPKRQARKWSLGLHLSIFIAALLPFANQIPLSDDGGDPIVQIVFSNGDISSGAASTASQVQPDSRIASRDHAPIQSMEDVVVEQATEENITHEDNASDAPSTSSNQDESNSLEGEGDEGDKLDGQSLGEMEFDGDGIFGRKVIYRADVAQIAEKNGRVVVNLCINNAGTVSKVAFNRQSSTILESNYVKKALEVASDYRFEKDYSAPATQCGQLSFIFKLK